MKKVLILGGLRRPDRTSTWVCRDVFGPSTEKIQYTLVGFQARDLCVDIRLPNWTATLEPESYDMVIHEHAMGMGEDSTLHANVLRGAHRLLKPETGLFVFLGWGLFTYGTLFDSSKKSTVFFTKIEEKDMFIEDDEWTARRLRLVSRDRGVAIVKEFFGRYGFRFSRTRSSTISEDSRQAWPEKYHVFRKV